MTARQWGIHRPFSLFIKVRGKDAKTLGDVPLIDSVEGIAELKAG